MIYKIIKTDNYLLVVDDEDKDFYAYDFGLYKNYKLGLVTGRNDDVLEFEGECIDESNLSKVIAHLPLNSSPILEGVPLLPPIEDDVEYLAYNSCQYSDVESYSCELGFIKGHNKAREKYNDKLKEVMLQFDLEIKKHLLMYSIEHSIHGKMCDGINEIRSNILQSLHQYPTEFECEMENYCGSPLTTDRCPKCIDSCDRAYQRPKTITTTQGVQWVGKYN
jgi:hypothetical protein